MKMIQKKQVKVLDKNQFAGKDFVKNELRFEFSYASWKTVDVPYEVFKTTVVNDTGILTYEEQGNNLKFIGFENDVHVNEISLDKKQRLLETVLILAWFLASIAFLVWYMYFNHNPSLMTEVLNILAMLILLIIPFSYLLVLVRRLKRLPEKKERVQLLESGYYIPLDKGIKENVYIFEFSNGKRKSFAIPDKHKTDIGAVHDTGILTYKEKNFYLEFIGFKNDQ